jgi:cytochrome c-type biogenesis protein CcmH/NrfG
MAAERDARDAFHGGTAVQRARAHVLVGQVLVLRGQPSAAADEFTEAIRLDPANEAAAAALARLRRQRGNP